jgi:hypothetical protein
MAAKKSTWIAGAALLGLVAIGGTWLLGVSPILDETTTIEDQKVAAESENTILEAKVTRLKKASENLPALKAELAGLQVGIPATEQMETFLRSLDGYQTAWQMPVVDVSVDAPVPVVDNQGLTSVEAVQSDAVADGTASSAAEPSDSATASTEDDAVATPAPAAAAAPEGFVAVPVTITVLGPFLNSLAFLSDLQADPRLFLITGIDGEGQGEAEAGDGRPATHVGDVEMVITGYLYVLSDPNAATGDTEEPADGSLPSLDPGKSGAGGAEEGAEG